MDSETESWAQNAQNFFEFIPLKRERIASSDAALLNYYNLMIIL